MHREFFGEFGDGVLGLCPRTSMMSFTTCQKVTSMDVIEKRWCRDRCDAVLVRVCTGGMLPAEGR